MKSKKRYMMAAGALAALSMLGSAPAAYAIDTLDQSDISRGGLGAGVGACNVNVIGAAVQAALVGEAGCAANGVGDDSGGDYFGGR